jgi:hypothetical protein
MTIDGRLLQLIRGEIHKKLSSHRIQQLTDVDDGTRPVDGDLLIYDGERWIPSQEHGAAFKAEFTAESPLEIDATETVLPISEVINEDTALFSLSGNTITFLQDATITLGINVSVGGTSGGGAYGVEGYPTIGGTEVSNSKLYASRSA